MGAATRAWLVMVALTIATMVAMQTSLPRAWPYAWIGALSAMTIVKGRLILLDFLELRGSGTWRTGIVGAYIALVAAVYALFALG